MPKWTAKLEVTNNTPKNLRLTDNFVHRTSTTVSFPKQISPGETGIYEVYTASGKPAGPEFSVKLESDPYPSEGSLKYHVNMPYPEHRDRHNSYDTSGLLDVFGFKHIPARVHDWHEKLTVSLKPAKETKDDPNRNADYQSV